jgi:hypothetical protein
MSDNQKIILFTNARDEKNMKEWVAHHLLIGFYEIYIIDHKSIVPLTGQFDNFNKDREKVFVRRSELDGQIKDIFIQRASQMALRVNADWFLYLDADEFFVINTDKINNVNQLMKIYKNADSVSFNWLIFGSNFLKNEPEGLILDNYTRSESKLNDCLKTFIRPREFLSPNAHRSEIKNPDKAFHANGTNLNRVKPVYLLNRHFINPIDYNLSLAYIAHYYIQSEETYLKRKINLPRDDWGTFRDKNVTIYNNPITKTHTIHSDFNDIINTSVRDKYSEKIKLYLKSIGE